MKKMPNHRRQSSSIWVTFAREGIHCYPAAVGMKGVEFLAHPHRHIFHFRVDLQVFHEDRDVEFILFKRWLESLFDNKILVLDYKSCEMLAEDIAQQISDRYGNRWFSVEVSEDGENGCLLFYDSLVS